MTKFWLSPPPVTCDVCDSPIDKTFIDGKTQAGPWACMCMTCYTLGPGVGKLGLGIGQMYERQKDKKWLKIGG